MDLYMPSSYRRCDRPLDVLHVLVTSIWIVFRIHRQSSYDGWDYYFFFLFSFVFQVCINATRSNPHHLFSFHIQPDFSPWVGREQPLRCHLRIVFFFFFFLRISNPSLLTRTNSFSLISNCVLFNYLIRKYLYIKMWGHSLASKLWLPLFHYYAAMVQWYRNRNVSSPFIYLFFVCLPESGK